MKKYVFPKNTSVAFILDTDTLDLKSIGSSSMNIDYTYIAPEDGIVNVNGVDKEVKKGDFLIKMYSKFYGEEQPIFIIQDPELIEYIKEYQKQREENLKEEVLGKECCDPVCN